MAERNPTPALRHALPDFVIVGNVACDVTADGWRAGGTAIYAAEVALGLGRSVGLVTAAPEAALACVPREVALAGACTRSCTSFENIYTEGQRTQILRAPGEPVPLELLPTIWTSARVALLGPVFREVAPEFAARFHGIVGVCAQGFLRGGDVGKRVRAVAPEGSGIEAALAHARVVFVSEEDFASDSAGAVERWAALTPIVALTEGRRGATIVAGGERRHIPAYPAHEVDPTGAGDAFAAGFLVALDEGHDPWTAGRFAAAVASLVVQGVGAVRPRRQDVTARMQAAG